MLGPCAVPALKLLLVDFAPGLETWKYPDCAAPYWRLYWNAAGRGVVGLGAKRYALEGDALLLIPPETHFWARGEAAMDHLYLHFLAGPPYDGVSPRVIASRAGGAEMKELRALTEALRGRDARDSMRGIGAPLMLAAALCYRHLAFIPPEALSPRESDDLASRIAQLVLEKAAAPPSNATIARELGASVPTLERRLRASTGRSLHAFALWVRVGEACIRLRHSDDTIDEIAEELGFADRSHFSRVFARLRGESPAAYRASSL
jgi:AraC-like DNA-binding protein